MGRPESIKEEDISAPMPRPLPQLDDSQINSNIQQQIASANLTRILNRVVQQVYGLEIFREAAVLIPLDLALLWLRTCKLSSRWLVWKPNSKDGVQVCHLASSLMS
jgi:hypothetical protein